MNVANGLTKTLFSQLGEQFDYKPQIRAIFPADLILTALLVGCPGTLLAVLVLLSSNLTAVDVICSTREIAHNAPISYSQGITDLKFVNDYCHQHLTDYEVNSTTGALVIIDGKIRTTDLRVGCYRLLQLDSIKFCCLLLYIKRNYYQPSKPY